MFIVHYGSLLFLLTLSTSDNIYGGEVVKGIFESGLPFGKLRIKRIL